MSLSLKQTFQLIKNFLASGDAYFVGLILLVVAMPVSLFVTSNALFLTGLFWILNGILNKDFPEKFNRFIKNPAALILTAMYLIHLVGLINTSDLAYGIRDIRIKIPLFLIPFLVITFGPISNKRITIVLLFFIASLFVATIIGIIRYNWFLHDLTRDVRNISVFVSHIRLSLMMCFAVFILGYWIINYKFKLILKTLAFILILWFIWLMIYAELLTGLTTLLIGSLIFLFVKIFTSKKLIIKIGTFLIILSISFISTNYIIKIVKSYYGNNLGINVSKIAKSSLSGNLYLHDTLSKQLENGSFISLYIQPNELKQEWNKRSEYKCDSLNKVGGQLYSPLIRYLTSKGLPKDSVGISKLTDQDVRNIENGITNAKYLNPSLNKRIYEIVWEMDYYFKTGNPSSHSVALRLFYWKTAFRIIKNNFWLGVGTGDTKLSFDNEFKKLSFNLVKESWSVGHNQYLTYFLTFGVFGFILFIISLFYPVYQQRANADFIFWAFFIIIFLSMFSDNTPETQTGVTFYISFYAILLFGRDLDKEKDQHKFQSI